MSVEFVKNNQMYGLYTPKQVYTDDQSAKIEKNKYIYIKADLVESKGTKQQFIQENYSTTLDQYAYTPLLGLGVAAVQLIYGIFELLGGILQLSSDTTLEGLRNIVRGGVQMVPIVGCLIMRIYDRCTKYENKIEMFKKVVKADLFAQEPIITKLSVVVEEEECKV